MEGWNFTFTASPPEALPEVVFRRGVTLHLNDQPVLPDPYAPAHTDSDIRVTFPDADIVHVADTWWNGHSPFIDYSTGGSLHGTVRAAEENVEAVTDKTTVIPGHGPVGDRRELIEFRDMLRFAMPVPRSRSKAGRQKTWWRQSLPRGSMPNGEHSSSALKHSPASCTPASEGFEVAYSYRSEWSYFLEMVIPRAVQA